MVSRTDTGWGSVQVVHCRVDAGSAGEVSVPALAYPQVTGSPLVGDRVLLNTTALERGLGTGGHAVVIAIPDRPEAWPQRPVERSGHLVKARYTPLQTMVLGVDDPEGEHHGLLAEADSIDGMPVITADLHSSLPAVLAGIRAGTDQAGIQGDEAPRVAYVMTDGGALPAPYSRTAATLRECGWLASVITAGQAYGGDYEAVTVHTALLAARHVVGADIAIVIQGPGNLGSGTRWGFSGVAAGEALNAAAVLGGRPVAALRVSQADARERHRGISHHSRTAYGRVLAHAADLPVPVLSDGAGAQGEHELSTIPGVDEDGLARVLRQVDQQAEDLHSLQPLLQVVQVSTAGLWPALRDCPVPLSTMGRGLHADPAAFLAAAVAGRHAVSLVPAR